MREKENLINELTIQLADSCNIPVSELKKKIEYTFSMYTVIKMDTTLPSTGDGAATKMLLKFFAEGKCAEGMGKRSLEQYFIAARQFCSVVNKELNMMTTDDVKYYLNWLRKQNRSDKTIKNKYLNLSSIYRYLFDNHKIGDNPMLNIKSPKVKITVKKPLSAKEVEKIRVACESFDKKKSLRTLAMFNFMLDTGVRVSELCGINIEDINLDERSAVVLGKGNKEREVVFSDRTLVRMQEYLLTREDIKFQQNGGIICAVGTPLFASYKKPHKHLNTQGVRAEMKKIAELSGVTRLHPHLIRATFATNLAEKGVPINIIAEMLGHANLHTINRYILLSKEQMKQVMKNVA